MPRIAATIGVIALIVFSVGFNISQYPIVWETSDASSHLLPSAESSQAKTAPDPDKLPPAEEPTQRYAARRPVDERPRYEEPVPYASYTPPEEPSYRSFERLETPDEPQHVDDSYDHTVSSPRVAPSSAKYGADADSSATVIDGLPARRMVPVIIPGSAKPADDSDQTVRRLPSIDQVNPVPADHQAVQLPMTPIPIYPATGF